MTRKHYIAFAQLIGTNMDSTGSIQSEFLTEFVEYLALDNPDFNRDTFFDAVESINEQTT